MAVKHRKLLPNQNSTCLEGDGCYDPAYGDYFLPLPPQPPPPPRSSTRSVRINQNAAIAGAVVATLLLLGCYLVVVKICFGWIRRNRATQDSPDGENQEFVDESRGAVMDHPIWYIRTIGLQPSVINTITILKYKSDDGLVDGTDCSVCLSAFREDEILRLLPKCNHAFHIRCIDTWLRSHTNCPLCRAAVVSTTANRTGNELIQEPQILQLTEIGENRETADEEEEPDAHGSGGGDEDRKVIEEIRVKRRSLSVDSSMAGKFSGGRLDPGGGGSSRNSRMPRTVGGGSMAECLHKGPVLMKRPFSYGGRRSMSCRH
ncbi:hypothetical protein DM860_017072 [Cuscuta australis]|uniref:RING-type E3 ubiquitin transferase n=1 Tax=Cuscuta australis TaxID=267555 RepID=A0A328DS20_9ASTE|nr:hypothetical protein DM860_017072 [Cuscuta australis]